MLRSFRAVVAQSESDRKTVLPYHMERESEITELRYEDYKRSIRNGLLGWHLPSWNELQEVEKQAVFIINFRQVA